MKRVIEIVGILGLFVCLTVFTSAVSLPLGQTPEWLPADGLTTTGVDAQGRTIYHLPYFGDFVFDQNNPDRIIQLGPIGAFTWVYDSDNKIVTLNTDWWGDLRTSAEGSGSKLGIVFPNVISVLQGGSAAKAYYRFDVHNKDVVFGKSIYDYRKRLWGTAIGIEKYDARSFYQAAEDSLIKLQKSTQLMSSIRGALSNTPVGANSKSSIDFFLNKAKVQQDQLLTERKHYSHYHNRLLDSPNWFRKKGASHAEVKALQNLWILGNPGGNPVNSLADLQGKVLDVYKQGLAAFDQFLNLYNAKHAKIQDAINNPPSSGGGDSSSSGGGDPDDGNSPDDGGDNPSSGGSSGGHSGGGGNPISGSGYFTVQGDDYSAPGDAFNVANDAIRWSDVIFTGKPGEGYDRSRVSTWSVDVTLHSVNIGLQPDFVPPHDLEWMIQGSVDVNGQYWGGAWWILVPYNGKYYAAPFEGFDLSVAEIWYGLGNLNWPTHNADMYDSHTRVLRGSSLDKDNTAVWGTEYGTPKSGVTYGFFLSSDIDGRKGYHRSNIVLKTFP